MGYFNLVNGTRQSRLLTAERNELYDWTKKRPKSGEADGEIMIAKLTSETQQKMYGTV
jgi:hypothetical protein